MLTNAGTPDPGNWTRQTGCSNTNTEILTSDDRWRSGSKSKLVSLVDIKRLRVWLEKWHNMSASADIPESHMVHVPMRSIIGLGSLLSERSARITFPQV